MLEKLFILGQLRGLDFDLGDLGYALIVLLSMLGGLGKWLRDRSVKQKEQLNSQKAPQESKLRPEGKLPAAPTVGPVRGRPAPSARPAVPPRARPVAKPPTARPAPASKPETLRGPEAVLAEMLERLTGGERAARGRPRDEEVWVGPVEMLDSPARPQARRRPSPAPPPVRRVPVSPARQPQPPAAKTADRSKREQRAGRRAAPTSLPPAEAAATDWSSLSTRELQRAIVLKEILGPPVALRDDPRRF